MKPFTRSAIVAGLIAGIIYMLLQMSLPHFLEGKGVWQLPNNIAAIGYGPGVVSSKMPSAGPMLIFLILHFLVSILFAMIVGLFARGATTLVKIGTGIAAGALLYYASFYVGTYIFSWFANFRGWTCLADHLIFGIITALIYDIMYQKAMKREQLKTAIEDGKVG
jgi:uncharacterized membrane protein YagU involved in acid resistance